MENKTRIRFNPTTKEVEIEGSEEFVTVYFAKLQEMLSGTVAEGLGQKEAGAARQIGKRRKVPKAPTARKKSDRAIEKDPVRKRVTNVSAVVTLIQGSPGGISTTELKEKTGLTERQIWSIVDRSAKDGKIRKMRRGMYGGV